MTASKAVIKLTAGMRFLAVPGQFPNISGCHGMPYLTAPRQEVPHTHLPVDIELFLMFFFCEGILNVRRRNIAIVARGV